MSPKEDNEDCDRTSSSTRNTKGSFILFWKVLSTALCPLLVLFQVQGQVASLDYETSK